MTKLAHDCAVLRIPFDSGRLYDGDDPYYLLWLQMVVERVDATTRAQAKRKSHA